MHRLRGRVPWCALLEGVAVALALAVTLYLSVVVWRSGEIDVVEYYQYAHAFWLIPPHYSVLPREYPPFALVPFSLTMLLPALDPIAVFGAGMAALVLLGFIGMRVWSTRERALVYVGYLLLAELPFLLVRYDIVPALATLAALWAARRRRFSLAYVLLAVATLLKLYPLVLAPLVFVEDWRTADDTGRGGALARATAFVGPLLLGFGLAYVRAGGGALAFLAYAAARPVQIESLPATLVWLGTHAGIPATSVFSFGSVNWTSPLASALAPLSTAAMVCGCLIVYWRQARGKLALPYAFLACLGVLLVTNKVFSSQYLIWILPVVADVAGLDLIWVVIAALTGASIGLYPFDLTSYPQIQLEAFFLVVALRNALLLAVILWLLSGRTRPILRRPAGADRAGDHAPVPVGVAAPHL